MRTFESERDSGKLLNGPNFHMRSPHAKILTSKILSVRKFYNIKLCTRSWIDSRRHGSARLEIESGCKLLVCLTETRLRKARNREQV